MSAFDITEKPMPSFKEFKTLQRNQLSFGLSGVTAWFMDIAAEDSTETYGAYPFKGRGKGRGKGKGGKKREGRYVKGVRPCRYWVNGHCKKGNDCPDKHEERFRSSQRAAAATQDTAAEAAAEQPPPDAEAAAQESSTATPFGKGNDKGRRRKGKGKGKGKKGKGY